MWSVDFWIPLSELKDHSFEKTPPGNTGSNCQNSSEISNAAETTNELISFADGRLVCRLHWLQGTVSFNSVLSFVELLNHLGLLLGDELCWDDGPRGRGKKYACSGHSSKGMLFAWNPPNNSESGFGWISIPGSVLDSVHFSVIREVCLELQAYSFAATRIDSAIDDFAKLVPAESVLAVARLGNFAGFRHRAVGSVPPSYRYDVSPYVEADGTVAEALTVYFGSKKSDKSFYYYRKDVESRGEIDSHRFESRHCDEQAALRFGLLCRSLETKSLKECLRLIGSFCTGSIDFIDRSIGDRLERHPRLAWWAEIVDALGESSLPVPRPIPTVERSVSWAKRQWETTLAILNQISDPGEVMSFAFELLESGLQRLTSSHSAIISRAKAEGFNLREYLDSLVPG